MECLEIYFDGACEPVNPGGVGTYGFVVIRSGVETYSESGVVCIGGPRCTNNYAEYHALIRALEWALQSSAACVKAYGDSQLVVRQMLGQYKVRALHLKPLHQKAMELAARFARFEISWVPRQQNERADALSKLAYCRLLKERPKLVKKYGKKALELCPNVEP